MRDAISITLMLMIILLGIYLYAKYGVEIAYAYSEEKRTVNVQELLKDVKVEEPKKYFLGV
jgi:hypothetical protein